MVENFELGDIVQMKKQHPCGSKEFEVIRLGADIKIKCCVCERIINYLLYYLLFIIYYFSFRIRYPYTIFI